MSIGGSERFRGWPAAIESFHRRQNELKLTNAVKIRIRSRHAHDCAVISNPWPHHVVSCFLLSTDMGSGLKSPLYMQMASAGADLLTRRKLMLDVWVAASGAEILRHTTERGWHGIPPMNTRQWMGQQRVARQDLGHGQRFNYGGVMIAPRKAFCQLATLAGAIWCMI
jgi:hypothetical protein